MRSVEFQLMVAACAAAIAERPIATLPPSLNWPRFLALANRHRVQALCWQALKPLASGIPEDVAATFRTSARETVVTNLRAGVECARLLDAFRTAGVPLLFLKGLSLAALAYANPYLKVGIDIDLLVEPTRLAEAAHTLRSAGYAAIVPKTRENRALVRWHQSHKESVWRGDEGFLPIDLHTRLADHPAMLAGLGATSTSQVATVVPGIALPTLADDELFAYLCVHGASSAWFRLKWVTDLAAWLRAKDPPEIARLYERSQQLGAGRAAGQALLLAQKFYATEIGAELRIRLATDRANRWLAWMAERQLLSPAEPTERFLGTATIHLSQLGLRPGWRFKLSEATRQLRGLRGSAAE